jgi:integrase
MADKTIPRVSRRVKFTATFVQAVIKGDRGTNDWTDTESPLRVKKTATGAQFFVSKKVDGRPVKVTPKDELGHVIKDTATLWTLAEARAWARGVVVDLTRGVSPTAETAPARPSTTFQDVGADYLVRYARTHTPTATRAEGYGVRYAGVVLGDTAPAAIDARAATALKEHYADSPSNARKAWGSAQRVMDLAVEQGLAEVNVFRAMKGPKPPRAKSRYPRLEDLAAIEGACLETRGVGADVVRFAMRLPLRTDAIASLTWDEVDLDRGELRLKAGDGRKFHDDQRLPLLGLAAELLAERRPAEPNPDALVFGSDSRTNPGGKFSGWSRLYHRLRARSGVGNWSCHDFRRSAVSLVAEHRPDASEESLDRLLTHAQSSTQNGVKKVYQRARGFEGMRQAAQAWDDLLRAALAGTSNRVALRRRSR